MLWSEANMLGSHFQSQKVSDSEGMARLCAIILVQRTVQGLTCKHGEHV